MLRRDLSVVIAVFNENKNLQKLHTELLASLKKINKKAEILYIDDGSTDGSRETLKKITRQTIKGIKIHIVSFRRNFGQTAAIAAGIDMAKGRYIAFLDADLQSDPLDLGGFYKEIKKGNYDATLGWRKSRQDDILRKFTSSIANIIIRKIFHVPITDVGCTLRIVKREILKDIRLYGEMHRILPVLIYWKTTNINEIAVHHRERHSGKSKYGYTRILKVILDLMTIKFLNSYGTKPAYVFGTFGLLSNILGFIAMIFVLYRKIILGSFVHRDPLFLVSIFFILVGIQLILMGLLAEFIMRVYFESQKKSTYEIKEVKSH